MGPVVILAMLALGADPAPAIALKAAPAATPALQHHLIDMVVAQVDSTVITLSDLVAETRLVLLQTGGPEVARAAQLSQGLLNSVLRQIVSRELLLGEVRRLKLRDVPDVEVNRALDGVRQRFASPADYGRFLDRTGFREPGQEISRGFDAPPGLVAIVLAELEVERFLDVRVRRNVVVRASDIALCYEVNRPRFGTRTLDEVKELIGARLGEEQQQRALESLLAQLERRATVRYSPGFESERAKDDDDDSLELHCPEPKITDAFNDNNGAARANGRSN